MLSPFKLLLRGGKVVDSEAGRVYTADVLIEGSRIVQIAPHIEAVVDREVDCTGKMVTAGFADAHVHIESSMVLPPAFGHAVLPHGTTLVIADPHEAVNVCGAEAMDIFIEEAANSPIDIFMVVPSSVPATPFDTNGAGAFTAEQMRPYAQRPEIVGLGEVMCFTDVINHKREIMDKIALFSHKTIDGHTAGMPDEWLDQYVQAGINNDHECVDGASMRRRYDAGMNIYIREGSAARDAAVLLSEVKRQQLDPHRIAFCTDDKHLATIAREGHISTIVRMALKMGFSWPAVALMASHNSCRYYHLADRGNIKVGYLADVVVCDETCEEISLVIKNGKIYHPDRQEYVSKDSSLHFAHTVKMRELTADDFVVPARLRHLALGLVDGQLLTTLEELTSAEADTLPMLATIERHGKSGSMAVCYVKGYGIRGGAVATSVSHDSQNVVCVGDNACDMALAANSLREMGGGYAIARGGVLVGTVPLPAFGLMSTQDATTTMQAITRLEQIAHEMGVNPHIDPFTTLSFITLPVIPAVRLLDTGLFDTATQRFL